MKQPARSRRGRMRIQIVKQATVKTKKQTNACDFMIDEPLMIKK